MASDLDSLIQKLAALPTDQRDEITKLAMEATATKRFIPSVGPQTKAYFSKADVLLFGGSPGGGKTALEIGLALNEHHRALIVRKNFVDLGGVLHTLDNILGKEYSATGGNRPVYKKPGGGVIEFMGLGDSVDSKQGNPHDLICVDEAAQVSENQVRMLFGWLRTKRPGQRCRVVLASNPPLDTVGDWLVEYFAPWLDPSHPNPAMDGELRYFRPKQDGSFGYEECEEEDTYEVDGVTVAPQSRTFIASSFKDNPFYDHQEYARALSALPDEVRHRLTSGSFMTDRQDDLWQCIPTAWVKDAMSRWRESPPSGVPMCAIGADIAQGGNDNTVLAIRHDGWYAPLIVVPGKDTPDGKAAGGVVLRHRRQNARVVVDLGGGWGGDTYGHLKENGIDCVGYLGVKATTTRTLDKKHGFVNVRSAAYWKLREALDPSQPGGSAIALPPDHKLLSDLCSPTYEITSRGIKLESKEDVIERLQRSPDRGDAVVMAWWEGLKQANIQGGWSGAATNRTPQVIARKRRL